MENTRNDKSSFWGWLAFYAILAVIAYGAFYFFLGNQGNNQNPIGGAPPLNEEVTQPMDQQEKTIEVSGNEFKFEPSEIRVMQGERVKITFKNSGQFPHNYMISELNIATKTIQPGESDEVMFVPDKKGTFSVICSVGNHAERGMTGRIIVE